MSCQRKRRILPESQVGFVVVEVYQVCARIMHVWLSIPCYQGRLLLRTCMRLLVMCVTNQGCILALLGSVHFIRRRATLTVRAMPNEKTGWRLCSYHEKKIEEERKSTELQRLREQVNQLQEEKRRMEQGQDDSA